MCLRANRSRSSSRMLSTVCSILGLYPDEPFARVRNSPRAWRRVYPIWGHLKDLFPTTTPALLSARSAYFPPRGQPTTCKGCRCPSENTPRHVLAEPKEQTDERIRGILF